MEDKGETVACVIGNIHFEAVRTSLERPGDEPATSDTITALMRAALIGHTQAIILLLDRGVDPNSKDESGRTPLMEAIFAGHTDTIEALLERGADPNIADECGWTALMEAASKGHCEIVKLLLAHNADVNARTNRGWTVLKTTLKGNAAITKILKEAGAR
ncbi:MAG TPA: ankyrin repeat domain-containing protein [Blastocatellia bacterium]|nr:ankyrin repeat domain-containing protein [Blastocatellia bacterium]